MQFFIFSCFFLILFCFALLIVLLSDPLFPRLSPSPFFILTCSSQDCAPFSHGLFVLIVAGIFSPPPTLYFAFLLCPWSPYPLTSLTVTHCSLPPQFTVSCSPACCPLQALQPRPSDLSFRTVSPLNDTHGFASNTKSSHCYCGEDMVIRCAFLLFYFLFHLISAL